MQWFEALGWIPPWGVCVLSEWGIDVGGGENLRSQGVASQWWWHRVGLASLGHVASWME